MGHEEVDDGRRPARSEAGDVAASFDGPQLGPSTGVAALVALLRGLGAVHHGVDVEGLGIVAEGR